MTPRWGLEPQEGRRLSTKMPPQAAQACIREITHKFVAHPMSEWHGHAFES